MLALAEIDLGTLTPEQREAAVRVIAALERLRAENETLAEEKASLAGANEAQAERIRRLEHLVRELQRVVHGKRSEKLTPDERQLAFEIWRARLRRPRQRPRRPLRRRLPRRSGLGRRAISAICRST